MARWILNKPKIKKLFACVLNIYKNISTISSYFHYKIIKIQSYVWWRAECSSLYFTLEMIQKKFKNLYFLRSFSYIQHHNSLRIRPSWFSQLPFDFSSNYLRRYPFTIPYEMSSPLLSYLIIFQEGALSSLSSPMGYRANNIKFKRPWQVLDTSGWQVDNKKYRSAIC